MRTWEEALSRESEGKLTGDCRPFGGSRPPLWATLTLLLGKLPRPG
jgi:hypothetical protein